MTISLGLAITIEAQADAVGSFGMELNSKKLSVVTVTIIAKLAICKTLTIKFQTLRFCTVTWFSWLDTGRLK